VCEPSVDTFVRTLTFTIVMLQSVCGSNRESRARASVRFEIYTTFVP